MLYLLSAILWLIPASATAQYVSTSSNQLSAMQRIMPSGAICSNLDWEPVSYCRHHSKGATLEIWTGANGSGASLSFDAIGNEGLALIKVVRTHFYLAGIPVEALNRCIQLSGNIPLQVAGTSLDLRCHVVEISSDLSLEIFPAPSRSITTSQQ